MSHIRHRVCFSEWLSLINLDPDERSVEDISFVDVSNVTAGQMNSTLTRKVRTGIPDHYQDSFNFLYYLTPKGIEQV
jgi:hypothetical protein